MTLKEMLQEERKEGHEEGRAEEIYSSVYEGDYSIKRGMEKLNILDEKVFREKAAALGFIIK